MNDLSKRSQRLYASLMHIYEVRPRKDQRGVDLISDVLPFGRLWYTKPDDAIGYATFYSRSHDAVIRVYDAAGNVTETHRHRGDLHGTVTRFSSLPNEFSPLARGDHQRD